MPQVCGVLSEVKRGKEAELEWKIKNFSLSIRRYMSPSFVFEGESWWLHLFPNSTDDGYMHLFLCRSFSCPCDSLDVHLLKSLYGSPIEVEFSVSAKTAEGRKSFERRDRKCFEGLDGYYIKQWINRSEFSNRQREYLSFGCLTILLTMQKAQYKKETQTAANISASSVTCNHGNITQDLEELLLNQEHSDVILRVKGEEFAAHKAILAARSLVFASTFRHEMKENKTGIVDIEDCDPSAFPYFLRFVYCNDTSNLSGENVFGLFTIADKYDCEELRVKCVRFIKDNLTVETFCKSLALALLHNEAELLRVATDFFIENAGKILVIVDWQTFAAENPIQSNELFIKYVNSTTRSNNQYKRRKNH